MEAKIVGDQLILSGTVVEGDAARVRRALENTSITTVVLRNSPGGDSPTGYTIGEMIRRHGLRTAVSGFCYSSCSRLFLGGTARYFTDDYPSGFTNVGFHGHYFEDGMLDLASVKRYRLRDWIVSYTDGKADPNLIDRWIYLPTSRGMIHFYHPNAAARAGAATFLCDGLQPVDEVAQCEPVGRTALDLGIITSAELLHGADRASLQVAQLR
ncbi:MAG: hypothetical protein JO258_14560 [Alphaproteobacteria bacterium]|nr:hypothetical protein [Alphaproteobacteria bacterium]